MSSIHLLRAHHNWQVTDLANLLPVPGLLVPLLDDVLLDFGAVVALWFTPLQVDRLVVVVGNLGLARRVWNVCNK